MQYVLKAAGSTTSSQPYSQYNPRPTPTTQHGNRLNRANQLRKPTKRTPDDSWLSQPQHNNRACFTSNISILNARKPGFCVICLVCSCFSPHEMPALLRAFRYITRSRSAQHRPLQSTHKLSPRRLEWSFVFIERKLDGRTTRQYTPSTSLNTFIDKASSETTAQHTRSERFGHTYATTHISADNKYSPAIKTAKSTKTRRMLLSDSPTKTNKTSINIDFLPLFHIKHRLRSGVLPPLNPSALPPRHPAVKRQSV